MTVKITINHGKETLATGTLRMNRKSYGIDFPDEDKFLEDMYNIERYINTQGAYRCHIETMSEKSKKEPSP